jgi:hypothetical protein
MASKNWTHFSNWAVGMKCTDFLPYVNEKRDGFNYRALGRAAKMPETGIRQSKKCTDFLDEKQKKLISKGYMVPKGCDNSLNNEGDNKTITVRKGELTNAERRDYERQKEEVIRLNEELRNTKAALKRFGKMEEYLMEFGVLPR